MNKNFLINLFVALFIPAALVGFCLSVNQYRDIEISGAVDCDAPLEITILIVPSLILFLFGIAWNIMFFFKRKKKISIFFAALCVVMSGISLIKYAEIRRERSMTNFIETCGADW